MFFLNLNECYLISYMSIVLPIFNLFCVKKEEKKERRRLKVLKVKVPVLEVIPLLVLDQS